MSRQVPHRRRPRTLPDLHSLARRVLTRHGVRPLRLLAANRAPASAGNETWVGHARKEEEKQRTENARRRHPRRLPPALVCYLFAILAFMTVMNYFWCAYTPLSSSNLSSSRFTPSPPQVLQDHPRRPQGRRLDQKTDQDEEGAPRAVAAQSRKLEPAWPQAPARS